MSRYIPEHPQKGSAEAYAWAEKMRTAREKKKRLRHEIRQAGLTTEQEFFGPGGPLAPKALKKRKLNPGAKWHQGEEDVAYRYKKDAKDALEKAFFAGVEAAHKTSGSAARKMGMNPRRKKRDRKGMLVERVTLYKDKLAEIYQTDYDTFSVYVGGKIQGSYHTLDEAKELIRFYVHSLSHDNPKKRTRKNPIAVFNPPKVAGTIYNNAIEIKAQKTGGPLKGHYKHIFGSKKVKILGLTDGTVLLQHTEGKPLWMTRKEYERSGRKH